MLLVPPRIDMASHILFVIASFLAILCALATASDPSPLQDFCVADPTSSVRINGLPCMDPKLVNANHFFSSGLHIPTNTSNPLGFGAGFAQIPGLNTLGLAIARGDFAPGGVAPIHSHPRASEIFIVLEGSLLVGFVTSNPENRFISKVLQKGEVFVFPVGLVHFAYNVGHGPASAIASFNSQNPGFIAAADLFATNPPISDDILAKAFQVDKSIIRKFRP